MLAWDCRRRLRSLLLSPYGGARRRIWRRRWRELAGMDSIVARKLIIQWPTKVVIHSGVRRMPWMLLCLHRRVLRKDCGIMLVQFTPKKGGTPRRNEIIFISPTGEEIKHKKQLDQYLRSHPGGPSSSEFDWGSGDTPRRSARISEKVKAVGTPEGEPPKKRERKSSSKKTAKEKDSADKEYVAPVEDRSVLESKYNVNTELNEAGDSLKKEKQEGDLHAVDPASINEPEEAKSENKIVDQLEGKIKDVDTEMKEAEVDVQKENEEGAASAVSDLDAVDQSSKNEPNEELKTETTVANQTGKEVKSEENVNEPEEKEGKAEEKNIEVTNMPEKKTEDKNIEVTNMPEKKTEDKNIEATNMQEEKTEKGNESTRDVRALEKVDKPMEVIFEKAADVPKEEEQKTEGQNAETNKVEPVPSVVEAEKENEKSMNFDTPKQPSKTSTVSC